MSFKRRNGKPNLNFRLTIRYWCSGRPCSGSPLAALASVAPAANGRAPVAKSRSNSAGLYPPWRSRLAVRSGIGRLSVITFGNHPGLYINNTLRNCTPYVRKTYARAFRFQSDIGQVLHASERASLPSTLIARGWKRDLLLGLSRGPSICVCAGLFKECSEWAGLG